MREILFRGQRVDTGEWVEGDLLNTEIKEIFYAGRCYKVHPETVGQYTGLKDKNGKMIFEGDVVKDTLYQRHGITNETEGAYFVEGVGYCKDYIKQVMYIVEDCTMYPFSKYAHYYPFGTHSYDSKPYDVEIIGTIHDKEKA